MNIEEILDYAFPITPEDRGCRIKMQKKTAQRERLRLMIERYKNGDIVHFEPLCIKVDMEEIMKKLKEPLN